MRYSKMFIGIVLLCCGCTAKKYPVTWRPSSKESVDLALSPEKLNTIAPGIPAYNRSLITYNRDGKAMLQLNFAEPDTIITAKKPQSWGNYQFPALFEGTKDGNLAVKIHLSPDAVASYGRTKYIYAYTKKHSLSWTSKMSADSTEDDNVAEGLLMPNGDRIKIITPPSISEHSLRLPKPVAIDGNLKFYRLTDLPENRQGVFIARMKKGGKKWMPEKAVLMDRNALRYSIKGEIPVVWWGDMKIASDGSIIVGIYPGYYINDEGKTDIKSGIFFYRSTDEGHTWKIQGRIFYNYDKNIQPTTENFPGFTEPAFEILKDGSFLCIMRTTDNENGPIYSSHSTNLGVTWSKPIPIAPAGVLPRLLQLNNGVLVLSSGRPGVQVRFSMDGRVWTKPFEMLNYGLTRTVDWFTTCGYTSLLPLSADEFYIVYSDFLTMENDGKLRKSIKIRIIKADPVSNR